LTLGYVYALKGEVLSALPLTPAGVLLLTWILIKNIVDNNIDLGSSIQ
jgi:hypothetical protein